MQSVNWNCASIAQTPPFYRMLPYPMHTMVPDQPATLQANGLRGRCFDRIFLESTFEETEEGFLKAYINLSLRDRLSMTCVEHLQFSTAFQDYYDFYALMGDKQVELTFNDPRDIMYIKNQGLHLLNYCADSLEMISSTFMTGLLWVALLRLVPPWQPPLASESLLRTKRWSSRRLA